MMSKRGDQAAIVARNATVVKAKQPILNSLSFTVATGVITGLLGPSGAGKTTLMRAMVGVQSLTKGSIKIDGLHAGDKGLRAQIGYVTQSPAIYHDLTVWQNINYFATLARASSHDVDRVIHQVDLQPQEKQLVATLSGGQKARVSLAIALLGNPDVLILDEPTVGLDPLLRKQLWALFRTLAQNGTTLIISSHVMDEAEHCDNVLLMRDGDIIWNDNKQSLLRNTHTTSVEAAFLRLVEKA